MIFVKRVVLLTALDERKNSVLASLVDVQGEGSCREWQRGFRRNLDWQGSQSVQPGEPDGAQIGPVRRIEGKVNGFLHRVRFWVAGAFSPVPRPSVGSPR